MLKLGPTATSTTTTKSRIFLIKEGGVRNSIFSNEILKTADLQKILKNLEFSRTEYHHIISNHVNALFPTVYDEETRTKYLSVASKFPELYKKAIETAVNDIDEEIAEQIKLRDAPVNAVLSPAPLSPTSKLRAQLFRTQPTVYDEETLKTLQTRKAELNNVLASNELTDYDKFLYIFSSAVEEEIDNDDDDDDDSSDTFSEAATLMKAVMALWFRAINPSRIQVDLKVGDILVYTGENSFSVKIIDATGKFQYYPIKAIKDQGIFIHASGLASIHQADRFLGTFVPIVDLQKLTKKMSPFLDMLMEDLEEE